MGIFDFLKKEEDQENKKVEKKPQKKDKKEKKEKEKTQKKPETKTPLKGSVLKKPVVSEKSRNQSQDGKYVFLVENWANKTSIKKEVEDRWNVSVKSVNTMRTNTKAKRLANRSGGTIVGKKKAKKKAIVTLAEGDSIDIFPV